MPLRCSHLRVLGTGLLLLVQLALAPPVDATRVRPLNLEQMADRADRVFAGRCVGVRVEKDPGLGRADRERADRPGRDGLDER